MGIQIQATEKQGLLALLRSSCFDFMSKDVLAG
jgi:hypothetical protein